MHSKKAIHNLVGGRHSCLPWGGLVLLSTLLVALAVGISQVAALDNGLARTPPMGWNSWNKFGCNVSEQLIKEMADAMVSSGLKDVGYQFVNIDDCWQVSRDAGGNIVADAQRFPSGIKALADYVHSKGLKLGIYTDAGTATCQGRPGSLNYEQKDANTYAAWGVDYIKEDWCNTSGLDPQTQYARMRDALAATGRSIVLSICNWGVNSPWVWGPSTGNLWRTTEDIRDNWSSMLSNFDANAQHASAAGPGAWNDPDMLEIGNGGMTDTEYRAHLSLWAISAAPLIAGNDLRSMTQATKDILMNPEVIAVDQDPLGVQGVKVSDSGGLQVWSRPLQGSGVRAVALLNRNTSPANITVAWSAIGLAAGSASVRDLWARVDLGAFTNSYTASVAGHGVVLVKITGAEIITPTPINTPVQGTATRTPTGTPVGPTATRTNTPAGGVTSYEAEAGGNTLAGGALAASCSTCSGGNKVGYVGNNAGTLQFNGVNATSAGSKTLTIYYLSGEARSAQISVNGGAATTLNFASSGGWTTVGTLQTTVNLNAGSNTIKFSGTGWAPDFDRITVNTGGGPTATRTNTPVGPTATATRTTTRTNTPVGPTATRTNTPVGPTATRTNTPVGPTATRTNTPAGGVTSYEAEAGGNTLAGGALAASCSTCSGGNKVGYVGNNAGTLQFNGVNATSAGSKTLTIYYLSGEARSAQISVNGGAATTLNFASSGGWTTVGTLQITVNLNVGSNTIKFSGTGWAPDFDRVTVNTP